ncbi:MAG: CotH kinase family protein [Saprospiraceae bacterium]
MRLSLLCILFILIIKPLSAQTFTATGGNIPDDGTLIVYDLQVSGIPQTALGTDTFGLESVCINIFHTWDSDLSISLRSPDGTVIPLFSGMGGDLDGFENTCLSSNADLSIFQAPYPFTGTFKPFGDMGVLNNGQSPNGTWQLLILDTYAFADAGVLYDWSVSFGNQPCQPFPFESSDLPIIKITTNGQPILNEPKIEGLFTLIDNGPGQRNYFHQDSFAYQGQIGIELHGNSTLGFPKKSYDLELRDTLGQDTSIAILGLPKGSDFVLGANFSDKTLMRNALSYELSRRIGQYASRTRFCEVFVDNTYQGVYTLTEKIRRDNDRVDIPRLSASDTAGTELTGGYIVNIDWNDTPGWFSQYTQPNSANVTYFQLSYPRWDEVLPVQSEYIRNYIDSFETALHGPGFQDPETGWRHFGDEKSFFDFLFINEMSKNVDGYRLSTYFYKQRDDLGGRLHMGPVWDFDLGWYNADYCEAFTSAGWAFNLNYVCADAGIPFWWERLFQDTVFTQNMACYWQHLRETSLSTDSIFTTIDSMASVMEESQERNFKLWPILGVYVWPNPGFLPDSYAGEVQKMKTWTAARLDWLDFAISQYTPSLDASYETVPIDAYWWTFTAQQPGLEYFWDFDDGTSSTEAAPVHQFPGTGTYKVQLTVSTPYGCSSTSQQILHIVNVGTNSPQTGELRLAPNPARDLLWIGGEAPLDPASDILIFNQLGQQLRVNYSFDADGRARIDCAALPEGAYRVVVRNQGTLSSAAFLISR